MWFRHSSHVPYIGKLYRSNTFSATRASSGVHRPNDKKVLIWACVYLN